MATPTITFSSNTYTISGGSNSDKVLLGDILGVSNSGLTSLYQSAAYQTSPAARKWQFSTTSVTDFTGCDIYLKNTANNQKIHFELGGDTTIGEGDDLAIHRDFNIHMGPYDLENTHTDYTNLMATDGLIRVMEGSRINYNMYLDHSSSAYSAEPGARNVLGLINANGSSTIRTTIKGGRFVNNTGYALQNSASYKPNGTFIVKYCLTSAVTVRDVEIYDDYVDIRPEAVNSNDWAAPTRGVFVSSTWLKISGPRNDITIDNPVVFGNKDDEFVYSIGGNSSWVLHGIRGEASSGVSIFNNGGRIVYINFKGALWATQLAIFSNGRNVRLENHIIPNITIIDNLNNVVSGANIRFFKKNPNYPGNNSSCNFSSTETSFDTVTDSNGSAKIGTDDGVYSTSIVSEIFRRYGSSGNVDSAYANASHANATYANNLTFYYSVHKFGQQIVHRSTYTTTASGGKKNIGTVQLSPELNLTSSSSANVPSTASSFDDIFDMLYKNSIDNKLDLVGSVSAGAYTINGKNIVLKTSGILDITDTTISIPCSSTVNVGTKITSLSCNGTITHTGIDVTGPYKDSSGVRVQIRTDANAVIKGSYSSPDGNTVVTIPHETLTTGNKVIIMPANYLIKLYLKAPEKNDIFVNLNSGDFGIVYNPSLTDMNGVVSSLSWLSNLSLEYDSTNVKLTISVDSITNLPTRSDSILAVNVPTITEQHTTTIINYLHQQEGYADACLASGNSNLITTMAGDYNVSIDVDFTVGSTISDDVYITAPVLTNLNSVMVGRPRGSHTNKPRVIIGVDLRGQTTDLTRSDVYDAVVSATVSDFDSFDDGLNNIKNLVTLGL